MKILKLVYGRQFAEQEQVRSFFIGKAAIAPPRYKLFDIIAAVPELAFTRNSLSVNFFKGINTGNVGQAGQDALSALVAQSPLNAEFIIQFRRNPVIFHTFLRIFFCKILKGEFTCHNLILLFSFEFLSNYNRNLKKTQILIPFAVQANLLVLYFTHNSGQFVQQSIFLNDHQHRRNE